MVGGASVRWTQAREVLGVLTICTVEGALEQTAESFSHLGAMRAPHREPPEESMPRPA